MRCYVLSTNSSLCTKKMCTSRVQEPTRFGPSDSRLSRLININKLAASNCIASIFGRANFYSPIEKHTYYSKIRQRWKGRQTSLIRMLQTKTDYKQEQKLSSVSAISTHHMRLTTYRRRIISYSDRVISDSMRAYHAIDRRCPIDMWDVFFVFFWSVPY